MSSRRLGALALEEPFPFPGARWRGRVLGDCTESQFWWLVRNYEPPESDERGRQFLKVVLWVAREIERAGVSFADFVARRGDLSEEAA